MNLINILALSGSLRAASYNTAVIKALQRLTPPHVHITLGDIGGLPLFNPDREGEHIPTLAMLNAQLRKSHGLIIASPEYAHGISGVMKNALDWLVGGVDFPNKPIMLVNTSPRATHAQASLREILRTMSGNVIENACVSVPLLGSELDADGILTNKALCDSLFTGLDQLCHAVNNTADADNLIP